MIQGYVLLVGSVDLVRARHRNSGLVTLRVRNELNQQLIALGWAEKAPFSHINLIIRYGETALEPVEIEKINKRHNELPVAIQVAISDIVAADKSEQQIESVVRPTIVRAVNAVAEKYDLPTLLAIGISSLTGILLLASRKVTNYKPILISAATGTVISTLMPVATI